MKIITIRIYIHIFIYLQVIFVRRFNSTKLSNAILYNEHSRRHGEMRISACCQYAGVKVTLSSSLSAAGGICNTFNHISRQRRVHKCCFFHLLPAK